MRAFDRACVWEFPRRNQSKAQKYKCVAIYIIA